jgi:hypothetical protein
MLLPGKVAAGPLADSRSAARVPVCRICKSAGFDLIGDEGQINKVYGVSKSRGEAGRDMQSSQGTAQRQQQPTTTTILDTAYYRSVAPTTASAELTPESTSKQQLDCTWFQAGLQCCSFHTAAALTRGGCMNSTTSPCMNSTISPKAAPHPWWLHEQHRVARIRSPLQQQLAR